MASRIVLLMLLVSCAPSNKEVKHVPKVETDSIPTITMGDLRSIRIDVVGDSIHVESEMYDGKYILPFTNLTLRKDEYNNLKFLGIDGTILYAYKNDEYTYLDGNTLIVPEGTTLSEIAREHGTSVRAIKEMNKLKSSIIFKGQELRVY